MYRRFATAIAELANYGGLPKPYEAKQLWDDLWHVEAHHSTAIEGNTLILREVEALLDQGRAVGSKELKDYMEVLGYSEASHWVYERAVDPGEWEHDGLIALAEIRGVHRLVMGKVWQVAPHPDAFPTETPGNFRQHDIQSFAGGMTPPDHSFVPSEISSWVDRANRLRDDLNAGLVISDVPERLSALHAEFERIHPFIDGNGRTGRLLLNLVLIRLGWPPVIVRKEHRRRYLKGLERADGGDHGPLAELLARSVVDSLHRLIPDIAGPAKFVPLEALVDDELSLSALRQAATRGRLDAILGPDRRYRSSRAAVDAYKASRYRRGTR